MLDHELNKVGLEQNTDKKELICRSVGKESRKEQEHFWNRTRHFEGKQEQTCKYLGGRISQNGTNAAEIQARIHASTVGWMAMCGFWRRRNVPQRLKRMVWRCMCQSALLAAMETVVLKDTELRQLEREQVKRLRALSTTAWHGDDHWEKLSNLEVLQMNKIHTVETTLRKRRLKWLKNIGNRPQHSWNFLATLCGQFQWSPTKNDH